MCGWRHPQDSLHSRRAALGHINGWIISKRNLNGRSLKTGNHPCHSDKGTSLSQFKCLILSGYDAIDAMDDDNLAPALEALIQISISLIGTVRKLSKRQLPSNGGQLQMKPRGLFKSLLINRSGLCSTLHCQDNSEQMTIPIVIVYWKILYFLTQYLLVQCQQRALNVHKYMPQILARLECSHFG